jgi:predicted metal-dependent phosphoesterase TrpH
MQGPAGRHGPGPASSPRSRAMARVDLHTHTLRSDGLLRPEELVRDAWAAGVRTLAITDHDTLASVRELTAPGGPGLPAGLELIAGVEINAVDPQAADGAGEGELHILGYGVDPGHDAFEATLVAQREGRRRRFDALVARMRDLGLSIDREVASLVPTDDDALGRPTIARCLVAAGHATSVEDAFDRLLSRGRPGYLPRVGLGPVEAIRAIRDAGGLASLAHFAEAPERLAVVVELREHGLAGLEVHYRAYDDPTIATLSAIAAELGLVATGGTDYHGDDGPYADRLAELRIPDAAGTDILDRIDHARR